MLDSDILVTCPKACAGYLSEELEELGYPVVRVAPAGVFAKGSLNDCMRLNLQLRTGLRVLWKIADFKAADGQQLYKQAVRIPWEAYIPADGYVSIGSSVRNDTIRNTKFAGLRLKDALVDRIREKKGRRPDTGNDSDKAKLFLYWRDEEVNIYLDTSGVPLSNRGYRVSPGKAPMRENLAASVLKATHWHPGLSLVNPMCGSGTLAIEAAIQVSGRPAGRLRENFGFMHLVGYRPEEFEAIRKELDTEKTVANSAPIVATDRDPEAIESARRNAELAGVADLIQFSICDFRETEMPEAPGVVILNPEYGDRMGEEKKLLPVYQAIGNFFKKQCSGYWGYVFTGNRSLGKRIGLKTSRKIEFYNGPIECRLFEYELYSGSRNPR